MLAVLSPLYVRSVLLPKADQLASNGNLQMRVLSWCMLGFAADVLPKVSVAVRMMYMHFVTNAL